MTEAIITAKAAVAAAYVAGMLKGNAPDPKERDIIEKAARVANGVVDRFTEVRDAAKNGG